MLAARTFSKRATQCILGLMSSTLQYNTDSLFTCRLRGSSSEDAELQLIKLAKVVISEGKINGFELEM